jgi:hypothetical protein
MRVHVDAARNHVATGCIDNPIELTARRPWGYNPGDPLSFDDNIGFIRRCGRYNRSVADQCAHGPIMVDQAVGRR